ncbi:MAG TPA: PAS domain S-box protein [Gaiellaceae bacterium]|nr:PAS domain S-box protein [Gaiellaceae bacterium]
MRHRTGVLLAGGGLLAAAPLLLADRPEARGTLLVLAGAAAVAAIGVGMWRHRPASRLLWLTLVLALVVFVVADALRSLALLDPKGAAEHTINAVYGGAYPLLAVALVLVLRRLAPGTGREMAIDGALLGVATILVCWPYLFEPRLHGEPLPQTLLELAQPVGDVLVIATLGGALLSAGRLTPSERLLAGGLAALFAGDVVYVAAPAWPVPVALAEAIWIYAYTLFAAAALHPSMRDFAGAGPTRGRRSAGSRLVVVATAGLVTPALLVLSVWRGHAAPTVVALGALVFSALVVARLALLVRDANRLRARAELTEARLRTLLDASPIGISLPPDDDPLSGRLAYTNRALQEMLGYTAEELSQLDWRDVTDGDTRAEDERLHAELVAGRRQSYAIEKTYRRRDGSTFDAEVHVSFARGHDGTPLFGLGLVEDVTERKRAERELVESEQRFRALLGGVEAMIWECRVGDWGYTFVSGGVEQLLGFPVERWLDDDEFWIRRLHPDDRERVVACARAGEQGTGWAAEYRMLHADGRTVWVRDVVRVVHDAEGRPERLRGVLVDITASKQAEEERELLLDQLRQKQKVEALGELAGGVAHDFNNLLTAITGYVDLARARAAGDATLERHLGEVRRSADRAAALTRQLLAFGRRQLLEPRVVELNDVVAGMADLVGRLVGDRVQVEIELDPSSPRVEADPNQLEQVILNLAVNARDAIANVGVLRIRTGRRHVAPGDDVGLTYSMEPGEYALLSVADDGAGMPESVRRRAFDPFFTTKAAGEGTGLGLSTVYGIVKQSGGHVELESEPGRGTAATVLLPLTSAPAEAPPTERVAAPAHPAQETVLLVEDEPAVRAVVEAALEEAGYSVVTAVDGVDALRASSSHDGPIDLVLSDVSMPRMGGLELLGRCAIERPGTATLLMTGYADAVPAGVPLLRKPFSLDELRDAVRDVLAESRAIVA